MLSEKSGGSPLRRRGLTRQTAGPARQSAASTDAGGASTLSSWARVILRALDARGIDGAALFDRAGLDRSRLGDPNARYPQAQLSALWRLAVDATGDEAFGLEVSAFITPTTFHALGFALTAAGTLREVFEQIVRYFRIVSDAADLRFERIGDDYHFTLLVPAQGPQPAFESVDAFAAIYVRSCRARVGRAYSPRRIQLRRPAPADPSRFQSTFRCAIDYGAAENLLVFDAETFDRPLDDANPELSRHNAEVLDRALARLAQADIRARVRARLIERLPVGDASAAAIAASLHLSLRSLQRKLAEAGSRFEAVLDDTRREQALAHLAEPGHSIAEIAYLLGFADTGSFSRAFHRWYACTPTQHRANLAGS